MENKKSNAYTIGMIDGQANHGTSGYKPGNRKPGGISRANYDAGFQDGIQSRRELLRRT